MAKAKTKTDPTKNVVAFAVAGKAYEVDLFDIDGLEWRDARNASGLSQAEIVAGALNPSDLNFDALAALLWVWRRRDEAALTYEDVLGSLSYGALAAEVVEAPDPPA